MGLILFPVVRRFEPGTAGWEAQMLPLSYTVPLKPANVVQNSRTALANHFSDRVSSFFHLKPVLDESRETRTRATTCGIPVQVGTSSSTWFLFYFQHLGMIFFFFAVRGLTAFWRVSSEALVCGWVFVGACNFVCARVCVCVRVCVCPRDQRSDRWNLFWSWHATFLQNLLLNEQDGHEFEFELEALHHNYFEKEHSRPKLNGLWHTISRWSWVLGRSGTN